MLLPRRFVRFLTRKDRPHVPAGFISHRHVLPAVRATIARHGLATEKKLAAVELGLRPAAIAGFEFLENLHEAPTFTMAASDMPEAG